MKPFTFLAAAVVSISLAVPAAASVWGSPEPVIAPTSVPTAPVTQWGSPEPVIAPTGILPVVPLLSLILTGSPSGTPDNGQTGQQPDPIAPVPLPASALLLLGGLGGLGLMRRRRKTA